MQGLEKPPRARRFERRPRHALPRLEITARDDAILRLVAEYRFLRSIQVSTVLALDGHSEQHTHRRLRRLYDVGFLDKPEEQWAYRTETGSRPTIYALGDVGAAYLEERHGLTSLRGRTRLRDRNRTVKERFVEHCLLVADVLLAFEKSARQRGDVRVIPPREILAAAPGATRQIQKHDLRLLYRPH